MSEPMQEDYAFEFIYGLKFLNSKLLVYIDLFSDNIYNWNLVSLEQEHQIYSYQTFVKTTPIITIYT